jgi:hypothetical protein
MQPKNFRKNKRGWIRIVEAFVAVLIITGLVLVIIGSSYTKEDDPSNEIYQIEEGILRDIQGNYSLRTQLLNTTYPLPLNHGGTCYISSKTCSKIDFEKPSWLTCIVNTCAISDPCPGLFTQQKDVYARSVIISSNTTAYNPRQLKLFCWMK